MDPALSADAPFIAVRGVTLESGSRLLQRAVDFEVSRQQILVIVGETDTGKSALLRSMVGLEPPAEGDVFYSGEGLWKAAPPERIRITARFGVFPAGGALLSTKTLLENVALPLRVHTNLAPADVQDVARLELALMGLAGYEQHYPSEVNELRRVCAGLARATAMHPEILFLEEPAAGLDPAGARRISELIIRIREDLEATVVVVSNDLAVVFAADEAVFLGLETKTMKARGNPARLREHAEDPDIRAFLKGGRP